MARGRAGENDISPAVRICDVITNGKDVESVSSWLGAVVGPVSVCPTCHVEPAVASLDGQRSDLRFAGGSTDTEISCENTSCTARPRAIGSTLQEAAERWERGEYVE